MDARFRRLVAEAPVPAVGVGVISRDEVLYQEITGVADLTTGRPVQPDDWWDLASLTKTQVTLPEVLDLRDTGVLDLDQPLGAQWAPARGRPVGHATPRALLSHSSGLPATAEFFRTCHSRAEVVAATLAMPLDGPRPAYSDLGFIVLGEVVRDLTGRSLRELAASRSGFQYTLSSENAVATEHCAWRDRLIVGEVHDENAAAMDGVAGHAGAFGTLPLVLAAAQGWLRDDRGTTANVTQGYEERFGLGWWLPPTRGLGGTSPGVRGFGCSGFVGNRIWLEPDDGYGIVVLSNRIHPTRGDLAPFKAWWTSLVDALR